MHQEKAEMNQINKIRIEKWEVTTHNAKIQRIIRDYYEQLYDNKMDNLEEIVRFLEKFNLLRLNLEEIGIRNKPSYKHWNWSCDKKSPKNKSPGPDGFTR